MPEIGKAGPRHQPDIARPDHRDAHSNLLSFEVSRALAAHAASARPAIVPPSRQAARNYRHQTPLMPKIPLPPLKRRRRPRASRMATASPSAPRLAFGLLGPRVRLAVVRPRRPEGQYRRPLELHRRHLFHDDHHHHRRLWRHRPGQRPRAADRRLPDHADPPVRVADLPRHRVQLPVQAKLGELANEHHPARTSATTSSSPASAPADARPFEELVIGRHARSTDRRHRMHRRSDRGRARDSAPRRSRATPAATTCCARSTSSAPRR